MKKLTLCLLLAGVLSGCASFPEGYERHEGVETIVEQYADAWSHEPAIRYVPSASGASISKYFTLPEDVAERPVSLKFNHSAHATVDDLIFALRAQGFKVVSRLGEQGEQPLMVRNFKGTLGEFVEELSHVQNIAYEFRNGTLFILEANRYSVSLPQHDELLNQVAVSLEEMGATNVRTDLLAGMVYFEAKPDISDYVTEYLDRIAQNSAMVRLQIAVVTVGLNRDLNVGLDWGSIMAQTGRGNLSPSVTGGVNGGNSGGDGGAASGEGVASNIGRMLSFTGSSGLAYLVNTNSFSLSAAVKALSAYGNARTEQNVVLGTVSGMPVRISSGNDIPYVKSIGSTTASGGATSGSSQTEIIRSGLNLEVTPNFDSSDNSVVTTVKVTMSSLVGFRELSAGVNLGTLSQPEMQNLEFENVGRLSAGETVVIGGITYDQLSNNYNNLPGLERMPTGSKAEKVNKNAIYIVVRPTVVIFSRNADKYNAMMAPTPVAYPNMGLLPHQMEKDTSQALEIKNVVDPRYVPSADYKPLNVREAWLPTRGQVQPMPVRAAPAGLPPAPPPASVTAPVKRPEASAETLQLKQPAKAESVDQEVSVKPVEQPVQVKSEEIPAPEPRVTAPVAKSAPQAASTSAEPATQKWYEAKPRNRPSPAKSEPVKSEPPKPRPIVDDGGLNAEPGE